MKNIIDIKSIKKKKEIKRYIIYLMFIIISIYIIYAIYLLVRTPTDTFTIESGVLTQEESATRSYLKRRNCYKRRKL